MDCSLPGSSIHGIFQARVLKWVAISFSIITPNLPNWAFLVAQLVKNLTPVWFLGQEDALEKGKGYPLKYSGLENSMDCIVHGVKKSWTQLSDFRLISFNLPNIIA